MPVKSEKKLMKTEKKLKDFADLLDALSKTEDKKKMWWGRMYYLDIITWVFEVKCGINRDTSRDLAQIGMKSF